MIELGGEPLHKRAFHLGGVREGIALEDGAIFVHAEPRKGGSRHLSGFVLRLHWTKAVAPHGRYESQFATARCWCHGLARVQQTPRTVVVTARNTVAAQVRERDYRSGRHHAEARSAGKHPRRPQRRFARATPDMQSARVRLCEAVARAAALRRFQRAPHPAHCLQRAGRGPVVPDSCSPCCDSERQPSLPAPRTVPACVPPFFGGGCRKLSLYGVFSRGEVQTKTGAMFNKIGPCLLVAGGRCRHGQHASWLSQHDLLRRKQTGERNSSPSLRRTQIVASERGSRPSSSAYGAPGSLLPCKKRAASCRL